MSVDIRNCRRRCVLSSKVFIWCCLGGIFHFLSDASAGRRRIAFAAAGSLFGCLSRFRRVCILHSLLHRRQDGAAQGWHGSGGRGRDDRRVHAHGAGRPDHAGCACAEVARLLGLGSWAGIVLVFGGVWAALSLLLAGGSFSCLMLGFFFKKLNSVALARPLLSLARVCLFAAAWQRCRSGWRCSAATSLCRSVHPSGRFWCPSSKAPCRTW